VGVGDEASQEIDSEVSRAAVADRPGSGQAREVLF